MRIRGPIIAASLQAFLLVGCVPADFQVRGAVLIRASQLAQEQQRRVAVQARRVGGSKWEYLRYAKLKRLGGPQSERWPVVTAMETGPLKVAGPLLLVISLAFVGTGVGFLAAKDDSWGLVHGIGSLSLGIGLLGFAPPGVVATALGYGLDPHVSAHRPDWIYLENPIH